MRFHVQGLIRLVLNIVSVYAVRAEMENVLDFDGRAEKFGDTPCSFSELFNMFGGAQ